MAAETAREALLAVLQDRVRFLPVGSNVTAEALMERALESYDMEVKNGVPEARAALDASIWFAREEVKYLGY